VPFTANNKGGSKQECVNLKGFYFQFYSLSIIEEYRGGLFPVNGDLSNVGLSSFVMWWRMSVDDVTHHERE
jgi:hypothetical protein